MRSTSRTGTAVALLRAPGSAETWLAVCYVAVGYIAAIPAFVVLLVLTIVSFPFMILALAGVPLLCLAMTVAHGVALMERSRAAMYLGADVPVRAAPHGDGTGFRRFFGRLTARGSWLELVYGVLVLPPIAWFGATITMVCWGGGLAFVLFPAYGWANAAGPGIASWSASYVSSALIHVVGGLALLLAAPWITRAVAVVNVAAARAMLAPSDTERLHQRVDTLQHTRSGMVDAADAERRRIERDLHDGAQQRLVSVAMTLGRAQGRFDDDPETARDLLAEAHNQAKRALADLRDLARGIHPAILTDRGLDAALSALASACPVPVEVSVDVEPRAPMAIEAVAYFLVAESLTNVAKHSRATQAWIAARRLDDVLVVQVIDDGIGGADTCAGSGLGGLRNRVEAVDGTFVVSSPPGGNTTIYAELPCAS